MRFFKNKFPRRDALTHPEIVFYGGGVAIFVAIRLLVDRNHGPGLHRGRRWLKLGKQPAFHRCERGAKIRVKDSTFKCAPWNQVWDLYFQNAALFRKVFSDLRADGFKISEDDAIELLHEFLVERAPYALATFNPQRGELQPWLFVVFRRFAMGTLQSEWRIRSLTAVLTEATNGSTKRPFEPWETIDTQAVSKSLRSLPISHQKALRVFFEQRGSIRSVAHTLKVNRREAKRLILVATAKVALDLGVDIGLDQDEMRLVVDTLGVDDTVQRKARLSGRHPNEARAAVRRVFAGLARLLDIERLEKNP